MNHSFLEELPFYPHLSEDDRALFLRQGQILSYQQGDLIYSPARGSFGMVKVLQGSIRTYLLSKEGKKATIFRLHAGEFCMLTMSCALASITFDVEVEATEDCTILLLPTAAFQQVEDHNIYLKIFTMETITEKFSALIEAIQQIMFLTLEQRLASYLLDESSQRKSDELRITQEQMAENIGSAREAVSRTLKRLKEQGFLRVGRGYVLLLDKKGLYQLL